MIIFTAPIIWLNHFSHSEEEILEMVREVSDDKKNDSLEFNEFIKVRLLLSIMMMMVCVVMMIIFDVSSFNQMVALSLKREPSQNKRELLEAFRQFDKYYFNASGVELESWILKLPVSAFCIKKCCCLFSFWHASGLWGTFHSKVIFFHNHYWKVQQNNLYSLCWSGTMMVNFPWRSWGRWVHNLKDSNAPVNKNHRWWLVWEKSLFPNKSSKHLQRSSFYLHSSPQICL